MNGKKRRITLGTVAEYEQAKKSVEDAREDAANLIHDLRHGKDPKARSYANRPTRILDYYLTAQPNLSERSRTGYRSNVEGWFKRWLDRPLREVTADMIEDRYRAIQKAVAAKPGKKQRPDLFVSEPGAATANSALRALRAVWYSAQGRSPEAIPPWPKQRFQRKWFRDGRRQRHVRADDLKAFHDAINEKDAKGEYTIGRDMRDLALLMLYTGFRRGEACTLNWQNVDFAAGVIRLPAKVTKSKRPLDLPMSDLVRDLLVARRALGTEGQFVFPGRKGRALNKDAPMTEPKKAFKTLSERCGFQVNPHALRSTFITEAENTPGITPLASYALVEHAINVGNVHTGYVQDVPGLREAAQAVATTLKKHCGIAAPRGKNVRAMKAPAKKKA